MLLVLLTILIGGLNTALGYFLGTYVGSRLAMQQEPVAAPVEPAPAAAATPAVNSEGMLKDLIAAPAAEAAAKA
jgi:hypothetical protein